MIFWILLSLSIFLPLVSYYKDNNHYKDLGDTIAVIVVLVFFTCVVTGITIGCHSASQDMTSDEFVQNTYTTEVLEGTDAENAIVSSETDAKGINLILHDLDGKRIVVPYSVKECKIIKDDLSSDKPRVVYTHRYVPTPWWICLVSFNAKETKKYEVFVPQSVMFDLK